jgi:hypothetical protein
MMTATPANDNFEILAGTHAWAATPHDYSSTRFLTFGRDGRGKAVFGYGQTIYADVGFMFELVGGPALRLKYLPSRAVAAFKGFEPSTDTAEKLIPYTLVRGEYRGIESVVAWPFVCDWLLTLADSPWPADMTFPYDIPLNFYGYRRNEPRQAT